MWSKSANDVLPVGAKALDIPFVLGGAKNERDVRPGC
jgi:hypothetical protein